VPDADMMGTPSTVGETATFRSDATIAGMGVGDTALKPGQPRALPRVSDTYIINRPGQWTSKLHLHRCEAMIKRCAMVRPGGPKRKPEKTG
jgi:hypothetical protein